MMSNVTKQSMVGGGELHGFVAHVFPGRWHPSRLPLTSPEKCGGVVPHAWACSAADEIGSKSDDDGWSDSRTPDCRASWTVPWGASRVPGTRMATSMQVIGLRVASDQFPVPHRFLPFILAIHSRSELGVDKLGLFLFVMHLWPFWHFVFISGDVLPMLKPEVPIPSS